MSSKLRHTDGSIFPIHVLGNGAIGLLYASALQHSYYQQKNSISEKNSKPVTLLMRSHHEHRLRKNPHFVAPVTILDAPRSREYSNSNRTALERNFDIPVELIGDLKNDNSPIKCILLCTKANDAINALSSVWKRVTRSPCGDRSFRQNVSTIIILSNGALAIRDAIYENFGKNSLDQSGIDIVLATTTHGAYKMDSDTRECHSRFRIMHAGEGSTFCTNAEFIDYCKSIGWDCFLLSDFEMTLMLWKKLAVNCVINPITAIHGVKNGELLNSQFRYLGRSLDYVMNHILEEISAVAMIDIESQFSDCSPKSSGNCTNITLMKSASQHLSVPVLKNFVTNVMSKTEDNVSSMLQDVRSERVTEVRLLNGYVVDSGLNKYNVECPWNRHLCEAVEALHPISEM